MEVAKKLRPLTKEDAKKSYEELQALPCPSPPSQKRTGLNTLDYFFLKHRLKAKTKRHISFMNALKNSQTRGYINDKISKIKKREPYSLSADSLLRERYSVFQLYYGTINQFRPSEAKRIYCTLKPTVGILDFSAGWGGRCLAAMACGIPYTGIDANTRLESSYTQMIELCKPVAPTKMIFKPSETVDFSAIDYDLVFTSPPYFMLEEYEKMPAYGSKEAFLEKFFRPVVAAAWKNLRVGGHMALNMPKEMYDAVKGILPPLWKRMRLPIMDRHATNAAQGVALGTKDKGARSEGIYVWRKRGVTQTRKRKK
jgi:hypothetical protein